MSPAKKKWSDHFPRGSAQILYHVTLVALSAGIALSLPMMISFVARNFLSYWSLIENEKIFLMSVEIALAMLLILFFNYARKSWQDAKMARMAKSAGMIYSAPKKGILGQKRIRKLKEKQSFAKDVMVISSTGFRTFVGPRGDLHDVLKNCREAKIMLLDPYSEGATTRAKSILLPDVTPERLREQISQSIDFLKELRALQKNIRLKLYKDPPFLKLAVLGDYIWVQHYHAGLDIQVMPEYVFEHDQNPGGLYTPLYQYFLMRWENAAMPEYDLVTDELIYREGAGDKVRREAFGTVREEERSLATC
jgi:hypothetical protein